MDSFTDSCTDQLYRLNVYSTLCTQLCVLNFVSSTLCGRHLCAQLRVLKIVCSTLCFQVCKLNFVFSTLCLHTVCSTLSAQLRVLKSVYSNFVY